MLSSSLLLPPIVLAAAMALAGCSGLKSQTMVDKLVRDRAATDRVSMFDQQEAIVGALSM